MKKNGFTLIEVLTVLIILSVVVIIAIPVVNTSIEKSRERSYYIQLQGVEEGAREWAAENIFSVPNSEGATKTLTLQELITGGYVDKNIKNPKTQKAFNNVTVEIAYESGTLVYKVYDNGELINFD